MILKTKHGIFVNLNKSYQNKYKEKIDKEITPRPICGWYKLRVFLIAVYPNLKIWTKVRDIYLDFLLYSNAFRYKKGINETYFTIKTAQQGFRRSNEDEDF